MTDPKFPEWYYGGPFERVDDPDRDLPRRRSGNPISPQRIADTEFSGSIDGERFIAPFRDSNSVQEILGCIYLAQGYPDDWDPDERFLYPTIQGTLSEIIARLETKICRSREPKRSWFQRALETIQAVPSAYAEGRYSVGSSLLRQCVDFIEGAQRRKRVMSVIALGPATNTD